MRHAAVLLNGAMQWAIRLQLAGSNPLSAVQVPPVPRSKAHALTGDEIAKVLATASDTRLAAFVTFAFATGMRRGELCALEWADVDLERGTVLVSRSLTETRDGAELKATKSGRSRTIPLSRVAVEALRKQRVLQAADKLAALSGQYIDVGAVFTSELGARIAPLDVTKAYGRIAKLAGVSSLRLHDARHSAATYLLVSGVDVRSGAGILGHASASTTLNTYAHVIVEAQRDAVDRLGDRLDKVTQR